MRKLTVSAFLLFLFLLSGNGSSAQQLFGLEFGRNTSTIKGSDVQPGVSISSRDFLKFGISLDWALHKNFWLQGKGNFNSKGYRARDHQYENKTAIFYMELQSNALGKLPIGDKGKFKLVGGAGLYLGLGLDYKITVTTLATGESSTSNGDLADFGVNYFDFGINALAGIELFNRLQLTGAYQPGFKNIFYGDDLGFVKNKNFTVTLVVFLMRSN